MHVDAQELVALFGGKRLVAKNHCSSADCRHICLLVLAEAHLIVYEGHPLLGPISFSGF
jgi:hypothetical protein